MPAGRKNRSSSGLSVGRLLLICPPIIYFGCIFKAHSTLHDQPISELVVESFAASARAGAGPSPTAAPTAPPASSRDAAVTEPARRAANPFVPEPAPADPALNAGAAAAARAAPMTRATEPRAAAAGPTAARDGDDPATVVRVSSADAPRALPRRAALSSSKQIDFSLATQASIDRAWMIGPICERWAGPIVQVVLVPPGAQEPAPPGACVRLHRSVQYVLYAARADEAAADAYPVNRLRNLALARVRTSHVLITDMDLWPDRDLYSRLLALARSPKSPDASRGLFVQPRTAFVVPAFTFDLSEPALSDAKDSGSAERATRARGRRRAAAERAAALGEPPEKRYGAAAGDDWAAPVVPAPASFEELRACVVDHTCKVFDFTNPDGHASTDYRAWVKQKPDEVRVLPCVQSDRFEPYLVLPTFGGALPLYNESFSGYGKNKITHTVHLRRSGWRFGVLPRSYVMHYPHRKSEARRAWEGSFEAFHDGKHSERRREMDRQYHRFLEWLDAEYGSDAETAGEQKRTRLCKKKSSGHAASDSTSKSTKAAARNSSSTGRASPPIRERRTPDPPSTEERPSAPVPAAPPN